MSKTRKTKHCERDEQRALVQWFRLQYPKELIIHVPNGYVRGCTQATLSWLEGVQPGFPDLFIFAARGKFHGLAIELKRPIVKGEPDPIVSSAQKEIVALLNAQGYLAVVSYGWVEAKNCIVEYLS